MSQYYNQHQQMQYLNQSDNNNSNMPMYQQQSYTNNLTASVKRTFNVIINHKFTPYLIGIGIFLIIVLLPISFQGVEYNEYAFKKNTLTQKVDWNTYYKNGNHYWGVNFQKFPFDRTLNRVALMNTSVIPSSGLEFFVDIVFYYHLDPNTIPSVYSRYAYEYNDQVVKLAIGVVKNMAPQYQFEQYFNNRQVIQDNIGDNLTSVLLTNNFILPKGMFMMQDMRFTDAIVNKYLQTAIQAQDAQTAEYVKQQNYVQLETNYLASLYNNNASYINITTATQISTLVANANSQAFTMKEKAKGQGLQYFRNLINVTKTENINTIVRVMNYLQYHPQIFQQGLGVYVGK